MSLVSNFIGGITSPFGTGGIKGNSFDINDTAFAELLEKQLKNGINEKFDISSIFPSEKAENINPISKENPSVTTSEVITFFSPYSQADNSNDGFAQELIDFSKRTAAKAYNKFSKNLVVNLEDFVSDIQELIS